MLPVLGKISSEAFANTLMPAYDFFVGGCCLLHGLMIRIKGARQSSHSGISVLPTIHRLA